MIATPPFMAAVPLAPVIEQVHVSTITLTPSGETRICATVTVDAANPVFAGHYPGLAVFPGVCQLECAHRTVMAAGRRHAVTATLLSVESARFLSAVSPGDELAIDTLIKEVDSQTSTQWKAFAALSAPRGKTATFVLRYQLTAAHP